MDLDTTISFRTSSKAKGLMLRAVKRHGLKHSLLLQEVVNNIADCGPEPLMAFLASHDLPAVTAGIDHGTELSLMASREVLDGLKACSYIRGINELNGDRELYLYHEGYLWSCPVKVRQHLKALTRITEDHWQEAVLANYQYKVRHCIGHHVNTYVAAYRENIVELLDEADPEIQRCVTKANQAIVGTMLGVQANRTWALFDKQLTKALNRIS